MKARKVLACLMTGVLTLSAVGCGETAEAPAETPATEAAPTEAAAEPTEAAPAVEEASYAHDESASITFADGNCGFMGSDVSVNPAAKEAVFEMTEKDGHAAVKVTSSEGGKIFAGIQMDALLGDKIGDVASVEIGLETSQGGAFSAKSGKIYSYIGGVQYSETWSIYMEKKNPKTITASIPAGAAAGDYLVLSLEDSGSGDLTDAEMYIYTISFKDASGNVLAVDTSAEYVAAASGGADRSNLFGLIKASEVGTPASAGGWAQADIVTISDEIKEKLVPGSVLEISYTSTTGNMWVVMNGAEAGWMRVGVGDCDGSGQQYSYMNGSRNVAQITYEQIAALCGDDVSKWGGTIQGESDGDWEVFSVKVGEAAPNYALKDFTVIGHGASGDGWAQGDIVDDITAAEVAENLVPGSVLEISYTSETGELWIVMPDSAAGWMRVGVGDYDGSGQGYAVCDGSKCYIPYETIAEICGDDVSTWGARIQAEASSAWEVFSVRVGTAAEFVPTNSQLVCTPGAAAADGWAQADIIADITAEDVAAALVPGSVININYKADGDAMWIVVPGAEAGWMRVGVGEWDGSGQGYAICNGSTCQIPYEMIAEYCGDDVSKWGTNIQAESNAAWEVYSVTIGNVK